MCLQRIYIYVHIIMSKYQYDNVSLEDRPAAHFTNFQYDKNYKTMFRLQCPLLVEQCAYLMFLLTQILRRQGDDS